MIATSVLWWKGKIFFNSELRILKAKRNDGVANEAFGALTPIGLLEAANGLHQKGKEMKTKQWQRGDKVSYFSKIFRYWNQIRKLIYSFL